MVDNISISPAAREEIARWRLKWNRHTGDPAVVVSLDWGGSPQSFGKRIAGPVIGFYGESQRGEIEPHVVVISDERIVFMRSATIEKFEGTTLDFDAARGFFLKDPPEP